MCCVLFLYYEQNHSSGGPFLIGKKKRILSRHDSSVDEKVAVRMGRNNTRTSLSDYTSFPFGWVLTPVWSSTLEFTKPQIVVNELLSNKIVCCRDKF